MTAAYFQEPELLIYVPCVKVFCRSFVYTRVLTEKQQIQM